MATCKVAYIMSGRNNHQSDGKDKRGIALDITVFSYSQGRNGSWLTETSGRSWNPIRLSAFYELYDTLFPGQTKA